MSTPHPYFGTLVSAGGELRWSAHLALGGRQVAVELSAPLDVSEAALDAAARVPKELARFDAIARGALADRLADGESVGLYVQHHLEELAPAHLHNLFGAAPDEIAPATFVAAMYLSRVWLSPGGARLAVLDYTIDTELTNYILAVELDEQGEAVGISMES